MNEVNAIFKAYEIAAEASRVAEEKMAEVSRPIFKELIKAEDYNGAAAFLKKMPSSVTKALFIDWFRQAWPLPPVKDTTRG